MARPLSSKGPVQRLFVGEVDESAVGLEIQTGRVTAAGSASSRKACASRSDTGRPMDLPSFFLSCFRCRRIGSSISRAVLMLMMVRLQPFGNTGHGAVPPDAGMNRSKKQAHPIALE